MPSWKEILEQFAMIKAAPVPFFLVTIAIIGILSFIFSWAYSAIITNRDATIQSLEARIKLRDDQLAEKLHSTPANEAQAIIKGLQDRINKISPRRLDPSKRSLLAQKLKLPSGASFRVEIIHDGACSDCNLFAADFSTLFSELGWIVRNAMVIGPGRIPPSGIGIIVSNPSALSGAEKIVVDAMNSAEIKFNPQPGPTRDADVGLLFTAKTE